MSMPPALTAREHNPTVRGRADLLRPSRRRSAPQPSCLGALL